MKSARVAAALLQVGLLQEDKVDPEEVARQSTIDWLNRSAQIQGVSRHRAMYHGQSRQSTIGTCTLTAVSHKWVCMNGDAQW